MFIAVSGTYFLATANEDWTHGQYGDRYGPGMMGMGSGMMGRIYELPVEKKEQLASLQASTVEPMAIKNARLRSVGLKLRVELNRFPIDREAVLEQRQTQSRIQQELFEMRLDVIAWMQEIIGSKYWRSAR